MQRASRAQRAASVAVLMSAIVPVALGDIPVVTGDFADEVNRLRSLVLLTNYVPPTAQQLTDFRALATSIFNGNYATAQTQASALNYDLVQFNDTGSGRSYYELREQLVNGVPTRGWGTFAWNTTMLGNAMVQVPHPRADALTESLGAWAFQRSGARAFLMAGAHRNANGTGTADVAHLSNSIFDAVHEVWAGPNASTPAYQMHGYDSTSSDYADFPSDTSAVLSNGAGAITGRLTGLQQQLATRGFKAYIYNTLTPTDSNNVAVNTGVTGTVSGSIFSDLAATTNVQGIYSRGLGGTFVHVEFSDVVRGSSTSRSLVASAVAAAISGASAPSVKLWDGGNNDSPGSWTANSGANWSPNGAPTLTDDVVIDNTFVPQLPSEMRLTATSLSMKSLTWNSNSSSTLSNNTPAATNSTLTLLGDGVSGAAPVLAMGPDAVSSTFHLSGTNSSGTGGTGTITLAFSGPGPISVANPGATLRISAQITSATSQLEKTGSGTLILDNVSNSFNTGIKFSGGVVETFTIPATGSAPATTNASYYNFNGGTWRFTGVTATAATARGVTIGSAGGTIEVSNPATSLVFGALVSGSGRLTKSGPGELRLNNSASPWTGGLQLSGGYLSYNNSGQLGPALAAGSPVADFLIFDGGFLRWNSTTANGSLASERGVTVTANGGGFDVPTSGRTLTINGIITGAGRITKSGPGTLTLGNSNNSVGWTGGLTISGGFVNITNQSQLGGIPSSPVPDFITFDGGFLRWNFDSTPTFNVNRGWTVTSNGGGIDIPNATSTVSYAGTVSGTGVLSKSGPGRLVLSETNTFGGLNVLGGTVSVDAASRLGANPSSLNPANITLADATTLQSTGGNVALSSTRGFTLTGTPTLEVTDAAGTLSIAGPITGTATINKTGAGTLLLSSSSSTFTGGVNVTSGTLRISSRFALGAVPASPTVNVNLASGTTLSATGSFTLSPNRLIQTTGVATLDVPTSSTYTFSIDGVISGAALFKTGPGALNLTGSNTYTGPFTLSAGTLGINSGFSLGATPSSPTVNLIMSPGTTLSSSATFTLSSNRQIQTSGTATIDVPSATDTFTIAGNISGADITKTGSGTLSFTGSNSFTGPVTVAGGTFIIDTASALGTNPASATVNISLAGGTRLVGNGNISLSANRQVQAGPGEVTIDVPNSSTYTFSIAGRFTGDALRKVGPGTLQTTRLQIPSITLAEGKLRLTAGSTTGFSFNSVTFTGGALDITDNDIVIRNAASYVDTLRSAVSNYYTTGTGIYSSLASPSAGPYTTLAVFVNAGTDSLPYFTSYQNVQGLAATDVIIKYTYVGDTNLDGVLDGQDYRSVMEGFYFGLSGWQWGDVDNSGGVTASDVNLFLSAYDYFQTFAPVSLGDGSQADTKTKAIPEPSALGLLAATTLLTPRRRR